MASQELHYSDYIFEYNDIDLVETHISASRQPPRVHSAAWTGVVLRRHKSRVTVAIKDGIKKALFGLYCTNLMQFLATAGCLGVSHG